MRKFSPAPIGKLHFCRRITSIYQLFQITFLCGRWDSNPQHICIKVNNVLQDR